MDLIDKLKCVEGAEVQTQFLFFEDYLTSGPCSAQRLCYIVAAKCRYPKRVFLLRGPQEQMSCISPSFFLEEGLCNEMSQAQLLLNIFCETFECFPYAAVFRTRILITKRVLSSQACSLVFLRGLNRPVRLRLLTL